MALSNTTQERLYETGIVSARGRFAADAGRGERFIIVASFGRSPADFGGGRRAFVIGGQRPANQKMAQIEMMELKAYRGSNAPFRV